LKCKWSRGKSKGKTTREVGEERVGEKTTQSAGESSKKRTHKTHKPSTGENQKKKTQKNTGGCKKSSRKSEKIRKIY